MTQSLFAHSDFNKDGFQDLLLQSNEFSYHTRGFKTIYKDSLHSRYILLGSPNGLIRSKDSSSYFHIDSVNGKILSTIFRLPIDFNQDGYLDNINVTKKEIRLFYGTASGYKKDPDFLYNVNIPARKNWEAYYFDYNGDGRPDILIQSGNQRYNNSENKKTVLQGPFAAWNLLHGGPHDAGVHQQ